MDNPTGELRKKYQLAVCRPEGLLDAGMAELILTRIMVQELLTDKPFNRFLDLTSLSQINLSHAELCDIVQARLYSTSALTPVRTAVLAGNALACGIARMYEVLLEGSPIEVRVFRKVEQVAEWLKVPVDALTGPPTKLDDVFMEADGANGFI